MKERKPDEALKPVEISLGNFIESMGKIEIVTGIMNIRNEFFQIAHSGWEGGQSVLPDSVLYETYPIPLTEEWKVCFGIEKYELPEWIKFVHQVQNYFLWHFQLNLLEIMDWDLLPKTAEIDLN